MGGAMTGTDAGAGARARARRVWTLLEPYHAMTYFVEAALDELVAVGLRGFWRGYFAGRAAPLGAVGAGPVIAAFYGFAPDFVRRAVPSVWDLAPPHRVIEARLAGIDAAVRAEIGIDTAVAAARRVVPLLGRPDVAPAGRVLYAANAELPWPHEPHLELWHLATLLREHRGDGHVAVLAARNVPPVAAHLLRLAVDGADPASIRPYRGWSDGEWEATADGLRHQGLIDGRAAATAPGRALHREIEDATDDAAAGLTAHLDDDDVVELGDALAPVLTRLVDRSVPYPNAMGVPPPPTGD